MADKYLNQTDLQEIADWGYDQFTQKTEFNALSATVDSLVTEGGEPNTIDTVKVNGTALTPDSNKAVDITVPTTVSQLTNDGDGTSGSAFATEDYVDINGGKIDKIKVNGTEQTITNKEVDLTIPTTVASLSDASNYALVSSVPTAVSDLTNDSGYQTASEVSSAISQAVASAYIYKGSVANTAALPSNAEVGDVYDVQDTGMNYAYNGTNWDALGQLVDTSVLWTSATGQANTLEAMTVQEVRAILYGD